MPGLSQLVNAGDYSYAHTTCFSSILCRYRLGITGQRSRSGAKESWPNAGVQKQVAASRTGNWSTISDSVAGDFDINKLRINGDGSRIVFRVTEHVTDELDCANYRQQLRVINSNGSTEQVILLLDKTTHYLYPGVEKEHDGQRLSAFFAATFFHLVASTLD